MDEFQNLANAISAQRISGTSLRILMGKVDTDSDGQISMEEFVEFGNKALDNLNDEVFQKKVEAFHQQVLRKRLEMYPSFNVKATVEARQNNLGQWTTVQVTALNDDGSVNVEVMDGPDKSKTWSNILPQHTRPLLVTGKVIEGRDVQGKWWPAKVVNRNEDLSYIVDLQGEHWRYRWDAVVPGDHFDVRDRDVHLIHLKCIRCKISRDFSPIPPDFSRATGCYECPELSHVFVRWIVSPNQTIHTHINIHTHTHINTYTHINTHTYTQKRRCETRCR